MQASDGLALITSNPALAAAAIAMAWKLLNMSVSLVSYPVNDLPGVSFATVRFVIVQIIGCSINAPSEFSKQSEASSAHSLIRSNTRSAVSNWGRGLNDADIVRTS
jgi:hypothetical protein